MKRDRSRIGSMMSSLFGLLLAAMGLMAQPAAADVNSVLQELNSHATVKGQDDHKSYKIIFDGYLTLSQPPMPIGPEFNLATIHAKMSQWEAVAGWAESNAKMSEALLKSKEKNKFGLPYGEAGVDAKYRDANLVAAVGVNGSLRNNQFRYLDAIDAIAAFATAETCRLMEAGQAKPAIDLAMAHIYLLRQLCDREFFAEKLHCIGLLSDAMSNLRDVFYVYQDKIPAEEYARVAITEIPFLRPDRARLLLPEADRVVSNELIKEVFNSATAQADPDKFTATFAEIQSKDAPLERFGAAKRWRMIAEIHDGLDVSLEKLKLIYDDWWRRWRVQDYDPILDVPMQIDRINPIRYAAVIYSIQNLQQLFAVRNQLLVEVNGTAVAAGLCGYKKTFGTYPTELKMAYTTNMRKRSDTDYHDKQLRPFKYMVTGGRHAIDTPAGRVWVEAKEGLLWGVGQNHEDERAATHSDDGADGDIIIWPPIKSLQRAQGQLN